MVHKTVLKVDISCERCKQDVFGIVSKIQGVNKIEADSEKGTIAVVGDADPYDIIMHLRKARKSTQFVSVGPPPKPDKPKDPVKICSPCSCPCPCPYPYPSGCWAYRPICYKPTVMTMNFEDPSPPCHIM